MDSVVNKGHFSMKRVAVSLSGIGSGDCGMSVHHLAVFACGLTTGRPSEPHQQMLRQEKALTALRQRHRWRDRFRKRKKRGESATSS